MKKIARVVLAAAAACVLETSAFAAEKKAERGSSLSFSGLQKYAKLTLGFTHGGAESEFDFDVVKLKDYVYYRGFEVVPTFGVDLPFFDEKSFVISVEASLALAFGSDSTLSIWDSKTTLINPGIMGVFNWHFGSQFSSGLQKFSPYGGLGFSVPIQIVSVKYEYTSVDTSGTYSTNPNYMKRISKAYENDSVVAGFRLNMCVGARYEFTPKISALAEFGCGFVGVPSWSARVGAMYRF